MPRFTRASRVLLAELQTRYKNPKMEPVGDADGLGVYRTVSFDKNSSSLLAKALPELNDPRIESFEKSGSKMEVTFVAGSLADTTTPFPLSAAEIVAGQKPQDDEPGDGGVSEE
jgi:hypothetical protein